jgi:hypothetical protein
VTGKFHGFLSDHNTTERKTNELLSRDTKQLKVGLEMFCWNHKYVHTYARLCLSLKRTRV